MPTLKMGSSRLKICLGLIAISLCFYYANYYHYHHLTNQTPRIVTHKSLLSSTKKGNIPKVKEGCRIPVLNPWNPSLNNLTQIQPQPPQCEHRYPLLFESERNSSLIMVQDTAKAGWGQCCYSQVVNEYKQGDPNPDEAYTISEECHPIEGNVTRIPEAMEFIAVFCLKNRTFKWEREIVDVFSFTPSKPEVEQRIADFEKAHPEKRPEDKVNVVILGSVSTSHMNFKRMMPEVGEFIVKNLSAIGMNGYNTIGDNTKSNMQAFLTSLSQREILKHYESKSLFHDDDPFLWKNFSAEGYRTSYVEDYNSILNRMQFKGFKRPPVDYYPRPLTVLARGKIGSNARPYLDTCYGPRLTIKYELNHMETLAQRMGKDKRYFQFVFATSLTHDSIIETKLTAPHVLSTLKWFHSKGYLNNTAFILMGDHGMRIGDVNFYKQLRIEGNMPLLYFILPDWFRKKYSRAVDNLRRNKDRLSTHFDAHETVKDLLYLGNLEESNLKIREQVLETNNPRGVKPVSTDSTFQNMYICRDTGPLVLVL